MSWVGNIGELAGAAARPWVWWAVGGTALLGLAAFGFEEVRIDHWQDLAASWENKFHKEEAAHATDVAQSLAAAVKQAEEFRKTEKGWQDKVRTAQETADAQTTRLQADLAARDAAAGRMQRAIASLRAAAGRPPAPPGTAASGPSPDEAAGMLADLCERSDRRSGILAEYADRLRISAEACVGAWPVNPAAAASAASAP